MPEATTSITRIAANPWVRRLGTLVGLGLLAAAVVYAASHRALLDDALAAIRQPDPRAAAMLAGGVLLNLLLTAGMFHLLMSRFGRVGRTEMVAVISAATLVNFLPLRPGLFGRIAYHKAYNGIAVRDSTRVVIEAAVISAILAGWLALAVIGARTVGLPLVASAIAPIPVLAVAGLRPSWRPLAWAAGLRHGELLVWALCYDAAFTLLVVPVGFETALACAAIAVLANLIPFVSNGLGVREWAVGLVAPMLSPTTLTLAVTAELVNRAVELVLVVVTGLASIVWLGSRHRFGRTAPTIDTESEHL